MKILKRILRIAICGSTQISETKEEYNDSEKEDLRKKIMLLENKLQESKLENTALEEKMRKNKLENTLLEKKLNENKSAKAMLEIKVDETEARRKLESGDYDFLFKGTR